MKIVVLIARILLGLLFVLAGSLGMYFAVTIGAPPPSPSPLPALAQQFVDVVFKSRYVEVVDAFQIVAGLLLLANRYVTLAVIILAAVLVNIFAYHTTMDPAGFPPAIVALVLWLIVAWSRRASLSALLNAR